MNYNFISTNGKLKSNFKNCLIDPIPENDTIWFPFNIIPFKKEYFETIHTLTFEEIAVDVLSNLLRDDISRKDIVNIVNDSFNFEIPLVKCNNIYVLELFHGPTFTFKDVGARFMSRILKYYFKNDNFDIIVSTSGDTGSAVADAFQDLPNVKVHIIYPKNKISTIQEKQLTTYGNNVFAYSINGNFDDCQSLIKETLNDTTISNRLKFFPANSISIARLIPQCLYYFWAYAQYKKMNNLKDPVICVPSGNLGNLSGGILAYKLGLPINHYIGATNINNTFERYLSGEPIDKTIRAKETLSNAMDISIPNNLKRLKYVFKNNNTMAEKISSYSFDDNNTLDGIKKFYNNYNYVIDPHTSIGYNAILEYNKKYKNNNYILVSTAHPSKFYETMNITNVPYKMPKSIKNLLTKKGKSIELENNYNKWKIELLKNSTQSVTFIGMPFTGKSYIGEKISESLKYKFVDFDREIELKFNKSLGDIVSDKTNEEFKKIEEDIVIQYLNKNSKKNIKTIFSPGGSIVYCDKAMKLLRTHSIIIYLDNPIELLEERMNHYNKHNKNNSRGIIFKKGMGLSDLYQERKPLYEKYKDIKIKVHNSEDILSIFK
jgi:threonine synthase